MKVNIKEFYPSIYDGIAEIEEIIRVENEEFDEVGSAMESFRNNQFVMTSDEEGVLHREKSLGILADPSVETLDFRKLRLLNRISMQPPFTMRYLREKLDFILGPDKYKIKMDYSNYTLYIEVVSENKSWYNEIRATLNMVKPANIVYVNIPVIIHNLLMSETIEKTNAEMNYKLGTKWILGAKPFISYGETEVLKLPSLLSIKPEFLEAVANFGADYVKAALINDSYRVTEFTEKTVTDNVFEISYTLTPDSGIDEISNVKLLGPEDALLSDSNLYVPVEQEVIMKHRYLIKEGV